MPVVEVRAYWRHESRSIRTGSKALAMGLGATLIAGIALASAEGQLEAIPGLLALIPAAIGMRGAIFGALGSRLATGILTGEFEPRLHRRTYLGRQVEASTILSIASATQAGVIAWAISAALGLPTVGLLDLVAISLVGGVLSSMVLFVVVVWMARRADAVGFSMDDAGAPIITATGDLVTLPALLVATLVLQVPVLATATGALGIVGGLVAVIVGVRRGDAVIRRVVRESLVVLTIAVTIDVLAGVVVESRAEEQFDAAALLILIPPFIANCGSLGGMLSSRLASKLHVGLLTAAPRPRPSGTPGLLGHGAAGDAGVHRGRGRGVARRRDRPRRRPVDAGGHRLRHPRRGRDRAADPGAHGVRDGGELVPLRFRPRQPRHPRGHRDDGPHRRDLPRHRHQPARSFRMRNPRTVKEMLVGAKDAAELMVDLAYAAIFYGDEDLAREVLRLEDRVDELLVELRAVCMIAARSRDDADQLARVLSLAVSIEGIADAAEDIARVALKDLGVPAALRDDLRHATEVTARVKIRPDNELEGRRLKDLELPTRTGCG
jgi:mgtE-like transporter